MAPRCLLKTHVPAVREDYEYEGEHCKRISADRSVAVSRYRRASLQILDKRPEPGEYLVRVKGLFV